MSVCIPVTFLTHIDAQWKKNKGTQQLRRSCLLVRGISVKKARQRMVNPSRTLKFKIDVAMRIIDKRRARPLLAPFLHQGIPLLPRYYILDIARKLRARTIVRVHAPNVISLLPATPRPIGAKHFFSGFSFFLFSSLESIGLSCVTPTSGVCVAYVP